MRIAVLSDIHSNHIALETCLEEAERRHAERYLFLGDYLGELARPQKTLEVLEQTAERFPCVFIRGNKENYWIDRYRGNENRNWRTGSSQTGMLAYVYERLKPEQIRKFEDMPISKRIEIQAFPPFVICHGSPWKASESLRETHDYIDDLTRNLETELTLCGHFHLQYVYRRHGKRVVNPGAVGVPIGSGGRTQFMMMDGEDGEWKMEFISLPYDQEKAIQEMDAERLYEQAPGWYRVTRELLRSGKITHKAVLNRVRELCMRDAGTDDMDDIPEQYWDMALEELGIP